MYKERILIPENSFLKRSRRVCRLIKYVRRLGTKMVPRDVCGPYLVGFEEGVPNYSLRIYRHSKQDYYFFP